MSRGPMLKNSAIIYNIVLLNIIKLFIRDEFDSSTDFVLLEAI